MKIVFGRPQEWRMCRSIARILLLKAVKCWDEDLGRGRSMGKEQNYLLEARVRQFIIHMPWFESSKEKEFRELIEAKMRNCLTKPNQYQNGFAILDSYIRKPNQKAIEMVVDHIKEVIKDEDKDSREKYQAMLLLKDLMQSYSKPLGKYVVKKILKRLTILAEHRKQSKDENRGRDIFSPKDKQPEYAIKFLSLLLLSIEEWGTKWPRSADGPHQDFHSAYNQLIMEKGVQFPIKAKENTRNSVPKMYRNSKDEKKEGKMVEVRSPKHLDNIPTVPVVKVKPPLSKEVQVHFEKLIGSLTIFKSFLDQNQEFGEMWAVIKEIVHELKKNIEEGNQIIASLFSKEGEDNAEVVERISANFEFLELLEKEVKLVDRRNEKYNHFNAEYSKKSIKIIVSLEKILEGNKKAGFSNNKNKSGSSQPDESSNFNQKADQMEQPRIQQPSRYDSTNSLKRQLELNHMQIKKEDFNSNNHNHSQGSDTNRNQTEKRKETPQRDQTTQMRQSQGLEQFNRQEAKDVKMVINEGQTYMQKTQEKEEPKKKKPQQQFSKISEKNESESEAAGSALHLEQRSRGRTRLQQDKNDSFRGFDAPVPSKDHEDSNEDFFKQIEKKEDLNANTMVNPRKNRNNVKKQSNQASPEDFFDLSVKSKIEEDGLSAFVDSKSNAKKDNSNSNSVQQPQLGFDTFKSPNEINNAMKGTITSNRSKTSSEAENPFEDYEKVAPALNAQPLERSQEDIFASRNRRLSNPFDQSVDNPFAENNKGSVNQGHRTSGNPFESAVIGNTRSQQIDNIFASRRQGNPFETKQRGFESGRFNMEKSQSNSENKSQTSNPFSEKKKGQKIPTLNFPASDSNSERSKASNPFQTRKPQLNKSSISNPFDTEKKSQHSQSSVSNPFDTRNKSDHNRSAVSNPFESQIPNPFDTSNGFERKSSKSISQRGSFKDPNPIAGLNRNVSMDDPFGPHFAPTNKANQSGFGFNFDDLPNISRSEGTKRSDPGQSFHEKSQQSKSGFDLNDFGEFQQNKNSFNEKDFFNNSGFPNNQSKTSQKADKSERDFFKQDINEKRPDARDQNSMQSSKKMSFNFEDLQNYSQSVKQKKSLSESSNPFEGFDKKDSLGQDLQTSFKDLNNQKASLSNQQFDWDGFGNISEKASNNQESKVEIEDNRSISSGGAKSSRSESKRLEKQESKRNIKTKISDYQYGMLGERGKEFPNVDAVIVTDQPHRWQAERDYGMSERDNRGEERSLSLHFEEASPFQKKQVRWDGTLGAIPSSTRYHVSKEDLEARKEEVKQLQATNNEKLRRYQELKDHLQNLKRQYSGSLSHVRNAKQQKKQFMSILNRLKDGNETKEKELEDLIKRIHKGEEIKKKILEKQRLLHDGVRVQQAHRKDTRANIGNKWERFNQNLSRLREKDLALTKSILPPSMESSRAY